MANTRRNKQRLPVGAVRRRRRVAPQARQKAPMVTPPPTNAPKVSLKSLPSSIGATVSNGQPQFNNAKSTVVSHREYIGDLVTSTSTASYSTNNTFVLQPGDFNTFPWLSALAGRYQRYRFRKVAMTFISESPSSVAGAVVIGFDRNAATTAPTTKMAMMELQDSIKCNAWDHASLSINMKSTPTLYTSIGNAYPSGPTGTYADIKTFASGVFWVGTSGTPVSSTLGELYIDYEIELINPGIFLATPGTLHLRENSLSATKWMPVGGFTGQQTGNITPTWVSTDAFSFNYVGPVFLFIAVTTTAASAAVTLALTNATGVAIPTQTTPGQVSQFSATTCLTVWASYILTGVTTVTLTGLTNANTAGTTEVTVLPYDAQAYGTILS